MRPWIGVVAVRRQVTAAASVALLATVAVGCGGGDETTTDSTQGAPLSQGDFVAQADAVCAQATEDLEQAQQQAFGSGQPSDAEIEAFVNDELIPSLEQQANAIDDLGPPDEDIDQVNAIVDALRAGIEDLEQDPLAVADESSDTFDEANRLAQEYGLQECGDGS